MRGIVGGFVIGVAD